MQTNLIISLICMWTMVAFAAPPAPLAVHSIRVSYEILNNSSLPFIPHQDPGPFGKALAMNIVYEPVKKIRTALEQKLGYPLKIFKGWKAEGEAHVTTVTPPEFTNVFSSYVSIQEIDDIARANGIQESDLQIEGIGRGVSSINDKIEETYFIIVRSERLLKIRREIYRLFISRGGALKAWNPENFYPHITIGFTLRDLHESDGVIKDKQHSLDERFSLELENK